MKFSTLLSAVLLAVTSTLPIANAAHCEVTPPWSGSCGARDVGNWDEQWLMRQDYCGTDRWRNQRCFTHEWGNARIKTSRQPESQQHCWDATQHIIDSCGIKHLRGDTQWGDTWYGITRCAKVDGNC